MTNFQLYLAGWKGMWYVLAIFAVLVAATFFLERRYKHGKKMVKTHKRHNPKRVHNKKYSA